MSSLNLDAISEALETIIIAILFNYAFLPIISIAIYVVWTKSIHRSLKSVWYISLGIPGSIAFTLFLIGFIFIRHGSTEGVGERIQQILLTLVYMPGFIVPTLVMVYHTIRFSPTERTTRLAFLFAIPVVLTYIANWIVFLLLEAW